MIVLSHSVCIAGLFLVAIVRGPDDCLVGLGLGPRAGK